MTERTTTTLSQAEGLRRVEMKAPDDVSAMPRLKALGWGARRIAAELGCSRTTVRRWPREGGRRRASAPERPSALAGHEAWLAERFRRHGGAADVVRRELAAEKGVTVSLRTVERAVAPLRQALRAEARATVRFETAPGEQLQIDFGERRVEIGDATVAAFLFAATPGRSRRVHVRAFPGERREDWSDGMESAFTAFGGVPAGRRRSTTPARSSPATIPRAGR